MTGEELAILADTVRILLRGIRMPTDGEVAEARKYTVANLIGMGFSESRAAEVADELRAVTTRFSKTIIDARMAAQVLNETAEKIADEAERNHRQGDENA